MSLFLALAALAVVLVAVAAVGAMLARAVEDARQLHAELKRVGQMRPLVAEIGHESRRLASTVARLRR